MAKSNRFFIFTTLLFISSASYTQETVYIGDVLYVPLRSGQGVQYRIINAAMKSGTKLTRFETSDDGEWSRVKTESGVEGWIKNQYLTEEKTAQLKLNQALTTLARMENENAAIKAQNQDLLQQNAALTNETRQETESRTQMARELEKIRQLSAGAIDLDRRYQELLQKHELTQTQRDSLLAENENLKGDQRLSFLLYGAGILFFGMVMATVLPSLRSKKRYSDWA